MVPKRSSAGKQMAIIKKKEVGELNTLMKHSLEDMNWYLIHHIADAQEPLLRSKLTNLYRNCEDQKLKAKLRGVLCFLRRWKPIKIYLRIAAIMEALLDGRDDSFMMTGRIMEVTRFVKPTAVVKFIGKAQSGINTNQQMICKSEKSQDE